MNTHASAAAAFHAISHVVRLTICRELVSAGEKGLTVGTIQERLNIPNSTLSHHLKTMEIGGIITRRREGTTHFCSANRGAMNELVGYLVEEFHADIPGQLT